MICLRRLTVDSLAPLIEWGTFVFRGPWRVEAKLGSHQELCASLAGSYAPSRERFDQHTRPPAQSSPDTVAERPGEGTDRGLPDSSFEDRPQRDAKTDA